MTEANHKATVAKGIFGYVFENRDKIDNAMYRTLTHDLGIIIRGDTMALPYTAGMEKALEAVREAATGDAEARLDLTWHEQIIQQTCR